MEIKPIFFVTPGVDVFVKYDNEDGELEYFKGKVEKINYFCEDENGSYVNCHIKYDNGDEVEDTTLYNHDFENPDSEEAWKLGTQISLLVKYLVSSHNDVEYLKEHLVHSDDDYSDEEEEDEVVPNVEQYSLWDSVSGFIKLVIPFAAAYYFRNELCALAN